MAFKMRGNPMKRNFGIGIEDERNFGTGVEDERNFGVSEDEGIEVNIPEVKVTPRIEEERDRREKIQARREKKQARKEKKDIRREVIKENLKNLDIENMYGWMRNLKG